MTPTDVMQSVTQVRVSDMKRHIKTWLTSEGARAQRTASSAFFMRIAGAGIVLVSQVVLARWMGSTEFGAYVYAWTWLLLLGDTIHLALPIAAQRFIPEYTELKQFDRLRGFVRGSSWIVFGIATIGAIAGAIALRLLRSNIDTATITPLYLACAALPAYALTIMNNGLARPYDAVTLWLLPHGIVRPLLILIALAGAWWWNKTIDATLTMEAVLFAVWAVALVQFVLVRKRIGQFVPNGARAYDVRGWLNTVLPMFAGWTFFTLLTYVDVVVLRYFRPAEDVAQYYAAGKILTLVAFIHYSVAAAVGHRITAYHASGDQAGLEAFARSIVRWMFWPSMLAIVLILALGKPILWLFGSQFVDAYPLMFILAIGMVARSAVGPAERVINMLGQQHLCALVYALALGVCLVGSFILAPRFGSIGVAWATTSAIVLESMLLSFIAKRRLGLNMFVWSSLR